MRASSQYETLFSPWENLGIRMDEEFPAGWEEVRAEIVEDEGVLDLIITPSGLGPYAFRSLVRFSLDWLKLDEEIGNRRLVLSRYIRRNGQKSLALRFGKVLR